MKTEEISFKAINVNPFLQGARSFIAMQEGGNGLSHTRFLQNTTIGIAPKATFARSKADLCESIFLEVTEGFLLYYGPVLLGEKLLRGIYSKNLSENLKNMVSKPATELLKTPSAANKRLLPVKAALALSFMAIPLGQFVTTFAKNLFTLKLFKQGNFDNIANLDKSKKIDEETNKRVEKSAYKNIKRAIAVYGACLAASALLLVKGKNSKLLQHLSELVLAPGTKLFKNGTKKAEFFNKYFSLDFKDNNGKLAHSIGQLMPCALIGGSGYLMAARDRGKQNFLETLSTVPLMALYLLFGNELLETGFKKLLLRNGKCKDLINDKLEVVSMENLEGFAKKLSGQKGVEFKQMYNKLLKQKIFISGVPLVLGIGVMGFFMAGMSRFFTKMRYNHAQKRRQEQKNTQVKTDFAFKALKKAKPFSNFAF